MPEANKPNKTIRSFSTDLAQVVQEKGGEAIKLAREEETRRNEILKTESREKKLRLIFIAFGLLALLAGFVVFVRSTRPGSESISPAAGTIPEIVFSDAKQPINLTLSSKEKTYRSIDAYANQNQLRSGEILNLLFIEKDALGERRATWEKLVSFFGWQTPAALMNLVRDYMFGLYRSGEKSEFMLLFRVSAYPEALAAIQTWEERLFDDLYPLFRINLPETGLRLAEVSFEDTVIGNYNARVIRDRNGQLVFFYTFLNDKTVMFGTMEEALTETVTRLYTPRLK